MDRHCLYYTIGIGGRLTGVSLRILSHIESMVQFVHVVRSEAEYDNVVLNGKVRLHVGPLRVIVGRCKCYYLTSRISDDVEFNHSSMLQPRQKPGFATGLCAQLETVARSAAVESRARPGYQHCAQ